MHFLFNTGYYKPTSEVGGPVYSVSALAEALVMRGHQVTVAAVRNVKDDPAMQPEQNYVLNGVAVQLFEPEPYAWQKLPVSRLKKMSVSRLDSSWMPWLKDIMPTVDVCDSQLGFLSSNRAISRLAKQFGKIHLYHQRGNLDPRRFGANALFKRIYMRCIETPILRRADALIALSAREAEVFASYAPNARIERVPNGVDVDEWQQPAQASGELSRILTQLREASLAVWHSRMVKMKGPELFVRAFAEAHSKNSSLRAIVAGPDEEGIRPLCEGISRELGVAEHLFFLDALTGENRRALLQRADIFVLPTMGEGLSMAMIEALACQCPVVTTPEANMPEIRSEDAGLIVPNEASMVADAISHIVSLNIEDREAMKKNALSLVISKFSMDSVVDRYLQVAEALLEIRKLA